MVRSVIPYSSTHLAKFVSSAHSNLVPHTHTAHTSLFTLSILLHRMPGNLRPFVPFPFDRKVSSSWAGWTDGATRQRVNCLSGYSQRLARIYTHVRCVVRAIRRVTRGCTAYIGRHAIVAPSNVNKYRGRSFRILDKTIGESFSKRAAASFKSIADPCFLSSFPLLPIFPFVPFHPRVYPWMMLVPFVGKEVSLSGGEKAAKRNSVINAILSRVRPADQ